MKELSIFIDESGDFGEYNYHSPYYIVSFVFHNQKNDISQNIVNLDNILTRFNINNNCIHTAPLVRGEETYQNMDLHARRKILNSFFAFLKNINISYKSFHVEKKHIGDEIELTAKLSKQIANFIKDNLSFFQEFNTIKIYYDNGQVELTKILVSVFNGLFIDVKFIKVIPSNYKLFQAADLFCYFTLAKLKYEEKSLSLIENRFFESYRQLQKNYLKQFAKYNFK
jgi:hypothetical protein